MSEQAADRDIGEAAAAALGSIAEAADRAIDEITGTPPASRPPRPFTYQGSTLVAEEHGGAQDPDAARPVFVLVHGIGMGRKVFGDLTHLLAEHGRVLAVDLPGYGEAPEPPRTPTMERLGDLVAAFVRAESLDRPVLIGHSMGTQVVVEAVARHPELTDRIVLVAPTVNPRERRAITQLLRLGQDLLVENPKVLLLGAREYLRAGPHLRGKMHAMLAHRPEDTYPRVTARALVVRGADDLVVPHDWCERVVAALPVARLAEVDGHGHETMIRDAAPSAELILEWLAAE